jgi:cobalt-zinc-cadmium efflux system outer membrane protein
MLARILSIAAFATLAGCQALSTRQSYTELQSDVHRRTGQRITWRGGTAEDEQAAKAVRDLLSRDLTADGAVQVALLNNRRLQAAYEELGIAQAAVVQAGLLRNPIFDVAVKFPSGGGSPALEMGVAQDFLEVLLIPVRSRIVGAAFEETKLAVAAKVLDVAGAARLAFLRVQADAQVLEMREQIVAAGEASLDFARRLRAAGNNRQLDVANEQASLAQANLDLAAAQAQLAVGRERLTSLMGLWGDDTTWRVGLRLPELPSDSMDLENVEKRAVAASLDLAMGQRRIAQLREELGLARSTSLTRVVEAGAVAERNEGAWEAGPSIAVPLPLFDQGQAKVAAAMARLRQEEENLAASAIELRSLARIARQRVATCRKTALFYRDEVLPLRQKITKETMLQYNAMQVGVFQLIAARSQQIDAGRRYIESLHDYWRAAAQLDLLLAGRASVDDAPRRETATMEPPEAAH